MLNNVFKNLPLSCYRIFCNRALLAMSLSFIGFFYVLLLGCAFAVCEFVGITIYVNESSTYSNFDSVCVMAMYSSDRKLMYSLNNYILLQYFITFILINYCYKSSVLFFSNNEHYDNRLLLTDSIFYYFLSFYYLILWTTNNYIICTKSTCYLILMYYINETAIYQFIKFYFFCRNDDDP